MSQKRSTIKGKANLTDPWEPCETTRDELSAIHALVIGDANKDQQLAFLEWLKRATGDHELEFRPGGEDGRRASDFTSGKRFIARQVFTLAKSYIANK